MRLGLEWQAPLFRVVVVALTLPLMTGCFLKPKKKSAKKSGGAASGLIVRDSIFMDRVGDGDVARVAFKTSKDTLCEMSFYSQEPTVLPAKEQPTVVACSAGAARSAFTEQLPGLRTDTLYFVIISAWEASATKAQADVVTVKETPSASSIISPGGASDGLFRDLMVARFNIPLQAAEVHRYTFDQPADIPTIKAKLTRAIGCQQGLPDKDAAFREAAPDVAIKSLASRDYAAANATVHPDYPERLQLSFPGLNEGADKWTLSYKLGDQDVSVPVRPISRILNMEMESGTDIINFDKPQLVEAVDPLKIDPTKPLKLSWTTANNLLELSYLTIQIGRPDYEKSIYCVFPADKRSGDVDAKFLQGLDDGKHVLLAELQSNQVWVKDGWLITTYDWRSGRIEK